MELARILSSYFQFSPWLQPTWRPSTAGPGEALAVIEHRIVRRLKAGREGRGSSREHGQPQAGLIDSASEEVPFLAEKVESRTPLGPSRYGPWADCLDLPRRGFGHPASLSGPTYLGEESEAQLVREESWPWGIA